MISSSFMPARPTSNPICRNGIRQDFRALRWLSTKFSSLRSRSDWLQKILDRVVLKCPSGDAQRFGNGLIRDAAMALANNLLPGHSVSDHIEYVTNKQAGTLKRRRAMAYLRVRHDVLSEFFAFHSESTIQPLSKIGRASCRERV